MAIVSFKDESLRQLLESRTPRNIPANVAAVLRRKLVVLDAATILDDLRIPPGNRLEALKGNREGQHSIRINDQYRLCFRWTEQGPEDVEFIDYH